jgi:succinate dehydrogenase (ubiquinone) cytochrome b560 subunit
MTTRFGMGMTTRFASTNISDPDAKKPTLEIDAFGKSQRLKRPIAPHLTIYQPQMTWLLSASHRILGAGAGGCISYS